MAEREIKQWITVNGKHIPIYEGESKDDAVKRMTTERAKKAAETAKAGEFKSTSKIKISELHDMKIGDRLESKLGKDESTYIEKVGEDKFVDHHPMADEAEYTASQLYRDLKDYEFNVGERLDYRIVGKAESTKEKQIEKSKAEAIKKTAEDKARVKAEREKKATEKGLKLAEKAIKKLQRGRIDFDDDIVAVYSSEGKLIYKGLEDYEDLKRESWKYDKEKKYYTLVYKGKKYYKALV